MDRQIITKGGKDGRKHERGFKARNRYCTNTRDTIGKNIGNTESTGQTWLYWSEILRKQGLRDSIVNFTQ